MGYRKILPAFCLFALAAAADCASAQERAALVNPLSIVSTAALPAGAVHAAWENEKLEFDIAWGIIHVGKADMWAKEIVDISGYPAYHIISTARSAAFIDNFYKVRDRNESWIDAATFQSKGYSKSTREGGYIWDEWIEFQPEAKKFKGQTKDKAGQIAFVQGEIPGPVQDVFSSLYYVRKSGLKIGEDLIFDVNTKKNWPLIVKVLKRETVNVPAGKFDCFVLEPKLRDAGLFVQKGKSMKVWVADDAYKTPVMMKAEIAIGSVTATLLRVTREK